MRVRMGIPLALAAMLLASPVATAQESKAPAAAAEPVAAYEVDPVHSSVLFRIKHSDIAYYYGRFNDVSGEVAFDAARPEASSIDVQVAVSSVDTNNEKRDQHLKSPDFFNAVEFPVLAFRSAKIRKTGENRFEAEGALTCHGVTKPLTITFEKTGEGKDPRGTERIGGESTFTISRNDYGVSFMPGGLSDDVRIIISLEAVKKQAGGR